MLHPTTKKRSNEWLIDGIRPPTIQPPPHAHTGGAVYRILKITLAGMLPLVCAVAISHVGDTVSYFSDIEQSLGSILKADPLDFSVALDRPNQIDVSGGDTLVVATMTPGEDSEPVQYSVTAHVSGGDSTLCSALRVLTTAPFPYDGPLASLATATTTDIGPWALTVSLDSGATPPPNSSCTIDLVYKGTSVGVLPGQGYKDEERVPLTFFIPAAAAKEASFVAPASLSGDVAGTSTEEAPPPDAAAETPAPVDETPTVDTPPAAVENPPAETTQEPPAETPPVVEQSQPETPPADVPPAETPPVETPPADEQ